MIVCSFTPSRMGIICSIFSKPAGGSCGCAVSAFSGKESRTMTNKVDGKSLGWKSLLVLILSHSRFRNSIDRRGSRNTHYRILLEQPHCLLHGSFELRIASLVYLGRRILHLNVRRHTFILDSPFAGEIIKSQIGRGNTTAIDRWRKTKCSYQSTPRARPHQWPKPPLMKHVR